jgi:hypothetical protein
VKRTNNVLKGNNNEVISISNRRPRLGTGNSGVSAARDRALAQSWVRPAREFRELGVREAAAITLGLILACLVFGAANALTGQAQETQAGHRSAWQGPKLNERVSWGAR